MDPSRFTALWNRLEQRQYFKLICGGSFSETSRLQQLITTYAHAGVDMVDVSAALPVVQAAVQVLSVCNNPPGLMVSFPLDADPHFRKIELIEPQCITCGLCVPVCPTQVFSQPNSDDLVLETPLCYGCGRCVKACPTDALTLEAFGVYEDLQQVLALPQVHAVELHTTFADAVMLDELYRDLGSLLHDKLISVCLRPQLHSVAHVVTFLTRLKSYTPYPLIVQVDGDPMSGSDDPLASLPAIQAAEAFAPYLPSQCYLTISGGINHYTAAYLQQSRYQAIQGVGIGTYARQTVWPVLQNPQDAWRIAETLVGVFRNPVKHDKLQATTKRIECTV